MTVGLAIGSEAARVTNLIPAEKEGKQVRNNQPVFPSRRMKTIGGRIMLELSEQPVLVEQIAGGAAPRQAVEAK